MSDASGPFVGTIPKVQCGALSGEDCDRWVTPDDEHCGDPSHVIPTRKLPPLPEGVSGAPIRRPRRAFEPELQTTGGPVRPLRPATFDPNQVHVARRVVEGFTSHHGVDEERARAELRAFVKAAIEEGRHEQQAETFLLDRRGIRVRLSGDGEAIIGYSTMHYERLPSEVLSGSPSRFSKLPQTVWTSDLDNAPEHPTEVEILALLRGEQARIAGRVLSQAARAEGYGRDLAAAIRPLRLQLAEAAGAVSPPLALSHRGGYMLEHAGRGWIISEADGVVVAMYRAQEAAGQSP